MKFIKYVILIIIVSVFVSSCQKDDQEEIIIDSVPAFTLEIDGVEVEANTLATSFIKTYTTAGEEGQLGFNISNNLDREIKLKMTIVDVDGNGEGMQICFETCRLEIVLDYAEIKQFPKDYTSSTAETHIFKLQDGGRDFECTIKINQVDDNGGDINGGKEVFFTYKYDAP